MWFWTFWCWSRESGRVGALLRDPLHGLGGNWQAWFRHEASAEDLQSIAALDRDVAAQRRFIAWIIRHWSREADRSGNRSLPRFVVQQLARVAPFDTWAAFGKYRRANATARGVSAIVLAQGSLGEAEDVRAMEALSLPDFSGGNGPTSTTEDFEADETDLRAARLAALSLLCGRSRWALLGLWCLGGSRPRSRALTVALTLGWLAIMSLILALRFGPDPGSWLTGVTAALTMGWLVVSCLALLPLARELLHCWREGNQTGARLKASSVWLRMDGGLILKGGSAGLAFCLNTLRSIDRAFPGRTRKSWIWRNIFRALHRESPAWAATGVITNQGRLNAVVLEPKLRACVQKSGLRHMLTPRQREARLSTVGQADASVQRQRNPSGVASLPFARQHGYAAEYSRLRLHRCAHLVHAVMAMSGLFSGFQIALTALAASASLSLLTALPDLRGILLPPPSPVPLSTISSVPEFLSLTFNTRHPEDFELVLDSDYWINRRAVLETSPRPETAQAELRLARATRPASGDARDGVVWIERRHRFLGREFQPGERVAQFSVSYLSRLGR